MKKTSLIIAALFASTMAFAGVLTPENINTNANTNAPVASAVAAPVQGQQQGQAQLQGQVQGINSNITNDVRNNAASFAAAASNSGGNTQNVTVTDSGKMDYSGSYSVKNVPGVVTGNVYPTSPCMGGTSVGGSGVGFGLSFGTSWTDDECGIRETARSFAGIGLKDDAISILCSSKYAEVAPICKK